MEFGKLPSLDGVDFALPPDGAYAEELLRTLPAPRAGEAFRAYLGGTAWGDRDFVGEVYPAGTRPADYLAAYAEQFNTIELNATYYRVPDYRQVRKWYASVPADFRFAPKVHKAISQSADLGVGTSQVLDFAKAVQGFEDKLGPCFLQLPPTFATERLDALREFLDHWPPQLRLAVEFRHASWFEPQGSGTDAWSELTARGCGAVITDVAGRRDVAHMHLTAAFTVLRWVGNEDPGDAVRLDAWGTRLAGWAARGLPEAYIFTHEPSAVPSARAAHDLAEYLRAASSGAIQTRAPRLLTGPAAGSDQPKLF